MAAKAVFVGNGDAREKVDGAEKLSSVQLGWSGKELRSIWERLLDSIKKEKQNCPTSSWTTTS